LTGVIGSIFVVRGHPQLDSKSFYSLGGHPASLTTLCLFTICAGLFAQEPRRCSVEIPAIVALPDATLVQRMGSDGFVVYSGPAKIEGVSSDRGTRRILFVVETGKQIPPIVRKLEAEIVAEILKNARPEDSFALLTAHGPRREVRFGASKETFRSTVEEIGIGATGKNEGTGVLDAIFEGINWFQPHNTGDAVLVLTMGIESSHQVSFAKTRDGIAKAGIHLFGFQLGPFIEGYGQIGLGTGPFGQPTITGWIDPNRENLFALSRYAGGFVVLENAEGDPWKEYDLTDQRLHAIRHAAQQEYKAIVEFYKIQLAGSPKDLEIGLADSIRKQLPQAEVIHPRNDQSCLEASSPLLDRHYD
jgi:hypothetical protein